MRLEENKKNIKKLHRAIENNKISRIITLIKENVDPFEKLEGKSAFEIKANPKYLCDFEKIFQEYFLNDPEKKLTKDQLNHALQAAVRLEYVDSVSCFLDSYRWSLRKDYLAALIHYGANPFAENKEMQSAFYIADTNKTEYKVTKYFSEIPHHRLTKKMLIDSYRQAGLSQYSELAAESIIQYCSNPKGQHDIRKRLLAAAAEHRRNRYQEWFGYLSIYSPGDSLNASFKSELEKNNNPLAILAEQKYFDKRLISGNGESLPSTCLKFLLTNQTYFPLASTSLFNYDFFESNFQLMLNISQSIRIYWKAHLQDSPVAIELTTYNPLSQNSGFTPSS